MATLFALLIGAAAAFVAHSVAEPRGPGLFDRHAVLPWALIFVAFGVAGGLLLASFQGHPRRSPGLVPWAATGLFTALIWAAAGSDWIWPAFLLGFMGGLIDAPLRTAYQRSVPADAGGNAMAVMNLVNYLAGSLAVLMLELVRLPPYSLAGLLWCLAGLAGVAVVVAWLGLFHESLELLVEIVMWPMYRIRAYGPGAHVFPMRGPVLVIANHAARFDPIWLAIVIPRWLTPLMGSEFYDRPVLHFLMRRLVRAIRVPEATVRREAPELEEAIAVLDRGDCIVLFPEGHLKRRAELALRRFGQGVWRILSRRPQTLVVVCWIEGGWGSYASWAGGPPMRGKPLDWRRRIDICIEPPRTVPAAVLDSKTATRLYLMNACLEARKHLDLAKPSLGQRGTPLSRK
jgi:1-acyl-sn-glycerol-3-phosphate acyltransferase